MLPPITKVYSDRSTEKYFQFAFFCDACGRQWVSEEYPFSLADHPLGNEEGERARTILYKAEHDAAYERANTEGLFHFNRCARCGARVCDECFSEFDPICIRCEKET